MFLSVVPGSLAAPAAVWETTLRIKIWPKNSNLGPTIKRMVNRLVSWLKSKHISTQEKIWTQHRVKPLRSILFYLLFLSLPLFSSFASSVNIVLRLLPGEFPEQVRLFHHYLGIAMIATGENKSSSCFGCTEPGELERLNAVKRDLVYSGEIPAWW